jgi:hypothetical protein
MQFTVFENGLVLGVHVTPSEDVIIRTVPLPTATILVGGVEGNAGIEAWAIALTVVKGVVDVTAVHVSPVGLVAKAGLPVPPAIHCVPVHTTLKTLLRGHEIRIQLAPSVL